MDGRKRRANYMKQGGLKMYASWVIWLIAFVKMIYLYAQIGQKGITFYAAALFTILFIYVLTAAVIPDVLGRMVYFQKSRDCSKNAHRLYHTVMILTLLVLLLFCVTGFLLAEPFSKALFGTVQYAFPLQVGLIAVFFLALQQCMKGYLEGSSIPLPGSLSGIVTALISLLATICLKNICSGAGTRAAAVFRQEDYYYAYAAVCGIGGLAVGAFLGFLFLLFVMLLATLHGLRTGLAASALACLSCFLSYMANGMDWRIIAYNVDNWIPFACFVIMGAVAGYTRDRMRNDLRFVQEEKADLEQRYVFLNELYIRTLENKSQYKNQIMSYRDSFGRIFEVTRRLNTVMPDEVFKEALIAMEDILDNQSICLYTFDQNARFGRLMVCSKAIADTTGKSVDLEKYGLMVPSFEEGEVWCNNERLLGYPEYAAPIFQNGRLVAPFRRPASTRWPCITRT